MLPLLLSVSLVSLIYLGNGPEKEGGAQSIEEIFESGLVRKFDRRDEEDGRKQIKIYGADVHGTVFFRQ